MRDYTKINNKSQLKPQETPEWERNITIATDNLLGKSYTELSHKYKMTNSRIGQICRAWRNLALQQMKEESILAAKEFPYQEFKQNKNNSEEPF